MKRGTLEDNTIMGGVMAEAFRVWASKDVIYKKTFKKVKAETLAVVNDAFVEMESFKPAAFETWLIRPGVANRYRKTVKAEQVNFIRELMYRFLTKYVRGELNDTAAKGKSRTTAA